MPWVILITACTGDTTASTPWSYEPAADRVPLLDAAAIEAAMVAHLPLLRTADIDPVWTSFDEVSAWAEGDCPTVEDYGYGEAVSEAWYAGGCTTSAGAAYEGYVQRVREAGVDENGWSVVNAYVYGVAAAVLPSGESWQANGYVAMGSGELRHDEAEVPYVERYVQHVIAGNYVWDGASADGTWLAGDVRITGGWASYAVDGQGGTLLLDGTVSGDLGEITALAATNLQLIPPQWLPCATSEPSGTVSLRDAEGGWYDVQFDGAPQVPDPTPSQCDGCGALWFEGARIGEVCPDLSALLVGLGGTE